MSEIKPGAKVRVTIEGEYQRHCASPDCEDFYVEGVRIPRYTPVEVISAPLPPEPSA